LVVANYNAEGVKGLISGGGTARRAAVKQAIEALGGTVESFDYAFGEDDVYTIVELPDNVTAAAIGLAVAASGTVAVRTIVLITPEEIDAAVQKNVQYSPPG
jgi:uncharacterized protein with GYD domain